MDVERALLARVVNAGDIKSLVNARITPDFFRDDVYRRVFEFMLDHWKKYQQSPDLAVMRMSFPSATTGSRRTTASTTWSMSWCERRDSRTLVVIALEKSATILAHAGDNPQATEEMLDVMRACEMQVRLETTPTTDIDFTQYIEEMLATLDGRMLNPGYLRGISSGFQGIDYVTGGWQPDQLVVMMGLPKAMKSSMLLYMAIHAHRQANRPLFLGFEMTNQEQFDRATSILANVGLTKVMNGTYDQQEHQRIARVLRTVREMRAFVFSEDISNSITVSGVQAKIMEYQPDVVFIDAAYLMQSEMARVEQGSAQALTDVARTLKQVAQSMRIPIVVTVQATQARTTGGKLRADSGMYTQAWRQSADVLLGVERTDAEQEDKGEVSITIKVLASRSGPKAATDLVWDWSKGRVFEISMTSYSTSAADDGT